MMNKCHAGCLTYSWIKKRNQRGHPGVTQKHLNAYFILDNSAATKYTLLGMMRLWQSKNTLVSSKTFSKTS